MATNIFYVVRPRIHVLVRPTAIRVAEEVQVIAHGLGDQGSKGGECTAPAHRPGCGCRAGDRPAWSRPHRRAGVCGPGAKYYAPRMRDSAISALLILAVVLSMDQWCLGGAWDLDRESMG